MVIFSFEARVRVSGRRIKENFIFFKSGAKYFFLVVLRVHLACSQIVKFINKPGDYKSRKVAVHKFVNSN